MGDLNFLHTTTDAAIWAREFCRLFPMGFSAVEGREGAVTQDNWEGLMIGWFANAIETGRDNPRPAPDVQVGVKPLRYIYPKGETLDEMREHARQDPLAQEGDMKLVWVNEGDLYNHALPILTAQPSPDVAALEDEIAKLSDLCDCDCNDDDCVRCSHYPAILDQKRAALARLKGGA